MQDVGVSPHLLLEVETLVEALDPMDTYAALAAEAGMRAAGAAGRADAD